MKWSSYRQTETQSNKEYLPLVSLSSYFLRLNNSQQILPITLPKLSRGKTAGERLTFRRRESSVSTGLYADTATVRKCAGYNHMDQIQIRASCSMPIHLLNKRLTGYSSVLNYLRIPPKGDMAVETAQCKVAPNRAEVNRNNRVRVSNQCVLLYGAVGVRDNRIVVG